MTFPGNYNINYYKGDTLEFIVSPKDASGISFPLNQYADPLGVTRFTIAPKRGTLLEGQTAINGFAEIRNDQASILCVITPANGALMEAGITYVYDVEIARASASYDFVYTLLTGNITVLEQVSQVSELELPGAPTNVVVTGATESSIGISWSAPQTGGTPAGYYTYITPYSPSYENQFALASLVSALGSATPFASQATNFNFTQTTAIAALGIPSTPLSPNTSYIYAVLAHNSVGISAPVGNFNVAAGTVGEQFTEGGS
jgi:hypothetical protein